MPYKLLASELFTWFAETLESKDHIGEVIADSRRVGDHQLLKTLNVCQEGHLPQINGKVSTLVKERVTALCFANKDFLSGGLEITDLVSYIAFFKVRGLLSENEDIGIPLIWEKIRGKKVLRKIKEEEVRSFFGIKKGEAYKDLK